MANSLRLVDVGAAWLSRIVNAGCSGNDSLIDLLAGIDLLLAVRP